jgi:release factor glutamine methyltransferase
MTIREALILGRKKLSAAGIENPCLDSEVLLGYVLGIEKLQLYVRANQTVSQKQLDTYAQLISLRCQHMPVAYIIKQKEFYGLTFYVKPGVLIPRPETEFLVEETLSIIKNIKRPKVADLCCGSGAISVAIAVNQKDVVVYASDISEIAGEVTNINAKKHKVKERITFLQGDLWTPFEEKKINNLDVIISNPPYIPEAEIQNLPLDVKNEPKIALNGGKKGVDFYQKILQKSKDYLAPKGHIVLEIGWNQSNLVKEMLIESGFQVKKVIKDYAGFDRVISGTLVN